MKRRDDFPSGAKEKLRARVGFRCSNPDCRVPTAGPGAGDSDVAHFGQAAHITAALPGGPRYDDSLSVAQRRSINNAIWLCSIHATEIDANKERYPASLLHEWKRKAEALADAEKGKHLPHADDARNELIAALSGLPVPFTHTAIGNVHLAAKRRLDTLDPRLKVETAYINGVTTFNIHALEPVPFNISIPAELAQTWRDGISNLIDHAQGAKLPATGIRMTGSPLIEALHAESGFSPRQMSVEPSKKQAVLKLKLFDHETSRVEQFDDCDGAVSLGMKSLRFEGELCRGLIGLAFNVPVSEVQCNGTVILTDAFEKWSGRDVSDLPYFEKLAHLFELLASGWRLECSLELDGLNALDGTLNGCAENEYFWRNHNFLRYTALARVLAKYLGIAIAFDPSAKISNEDFKVLEEAVEIFEGRKVYGRSSFSENPTCQLLAEDGASNIRQLIATDRAETAMYLRVHEGDLIGVFRQQVRLPRVEVHIEGVIPRVQQEIASIKDGDSVSVEWIPTDNFKLSYRFMECNEGPATDASDEVGP